MDRIKEAMIKIKENYVEDVDMEKLVSGAISGMASGTGDPYTRYVSKEEFDKMLVEGKEQYDGIGVHITYDKETGGILILGVMPNSPALREDLKAGDVILQVGPTIVTIENYTKCVDDLKGKAGTEIALKIKRGNDLIEKNVPREKVIANNVESEILDKNIGYIRIWAFENDVYKQFKTEYDSLRAKNVSGIIVDLRNNPGGIVPETVNILNLLLPKCDVLRLVPKDGKEKVYKTDDENKIDIPLAVLVNSKSASAAEIFASAIKDSNKGVIIGNKTYGKGIVQTVERLSAKDAISITTSKYYTPSGIEIHKNGIEPNFIVDLPEEVRNDTTIDKAKDTQLSRAIEYITTGK
ncbi:MAG: S41 family peptidase [Clostridia bacterium]